VEKSDLEKDRDLRGKLPSLCLEDEAGIVRKCPSVKSCHYQDTILGKLLSSLGFMCKLVEAQGNVGD
jgi:hypothetical protein